MVRRPKTPVEIEEPSELHHKSPPPPYEKEKASNKSEPPAQPLPPPPIPTDDMEAISDDEELPDLPPDNFMEEDENPNEEGKLKFSLLPDFICFKRTKGAKSAKE